MQQEQKNLFVFLFGVPMTDGLRCSFGCDKNEEMIEERESRERGVGRSGKDGKHAKRNERESWASIACP